jgi:hypothetical protein
MNTNPNQTTIKDSQKFSNSLGLPRRKFLTAFGAIAGGVLVGGEASAKSPLKLTKWEGMVDLTPGRVAPFELNGTASHLGQFTAFGEVEFLPGPGEGSLIGEGIVVFEAANGDLLVGVLSWDVDEGGSGGQIHHVSWRDSVEFTDGKVVSSTGRLVDDRPPGVVTIEYLILGTFLALALIVGIQAPTPKGSR